MSHADLLAATLAALAPVADQLPDAPWRDTDRSERLTVRPWLASAACPAAVALDGPQPFVGTPAVARARRSAAVLDRLLLGDPDPRRAPRPATPAEGYRAVLTSRLHRRVAMGLAERGGPAGEGGPRRRGPPPRLAVALVCSPDWPPPDADARRPPPHVDAPESPPPAARRGRSRARPPRRHPLPRHRDRGRSPEHDAAAPRLRGARRDARAPPAAGSRPGPPARHRPTLARSRSTRRSCSRASPPAPSGRRRRSGSTRATDRLAAAGPRAALSPCAHRSRARRAPPGWRGPGRLRSGSCRRPEPGPASPFGVVLRRSRLKRAERAGRRTRLPAAVGWRRPASSSPRRSLSRRPCSQPRSVPRDAPRRPHHASWRWLLLGLFAGVGRSSPAPLPPRRSRPRSRPPRRHPRRQQRPRQVDARQGRRGHDDDDGSAPACHHDDDGADVTGDPTATRTAPGRCAGRQGHVDLAARAGRWRRPRRHRRPGPGRRSDPPLRAHRVEPQGFYAGAFLDAILPAAHAAGIRVYGWDFPYLEDVQTTSTGRMQAILYRTPDGHRIDGFVPDIESQAEGTNLTAEAPWPTRTGLRNWVGAAYPLIICVPRPSEHAIAVFPYGAVLPFYDAVAPMVYWLNRQPDSDVVGAIQWLAQFGKPVIPVGQAYDGGPEGGRPGRRRREEIRASSPPPSRRRHRRLVLVLAARHPGHLGRHRRSAGDRPAAARRTAGPAPRSSPCRSQLGSLGYPVPVSGCVGSADRRRAAGPPGRPRRRADRRAGCDGASRAARSAGPARRCSLTRP